MQLCLSGTGSLSLTELEKHLQGESMRPLLDSFGIASSDAGTFCKLLDVEVGGLVDQSKFGEWCFRLVARTVGAVSFGPPMHGRQEAGGRQVEEQ